MTAAVIVLAVLNWFQYLFAKGWTRTAEMSTKDADVTSHRAEVPARLIRPRPSALRVLVVTAELALPVAGIAAIAGWLPIWVAVVAVAVTMGRDVAPRVLARAPKVLAAARRHGRNVFRRSLKSHQPQA